jgi:hypothetical protein
MQNCTFYNIFSYVCGHRMQFCANDYENVLSYPSHRGISIDYLVGKTTLLLDQDTLKRLEEINALNEDAKSYILQHVDMMVRDFKNIKAYSK